MKARRGDVVDPLVAGFGLLALWIAIELLFGSGWLRIRSIQQAQQRPWPSHSQRGAEPKLIDLLAAQPIGSRRVWFAPYTTFPESGIVESRYRRGIYDTFLAFPRSGISSNFGAFNLSAPDSLFAQASSQGLVAEARLAQQLGYRDFALDLGALADSRSAISLCRLSKGCQLTRDAYALFPLIGPELGWIGQLQGLERNLPLMPQHSAAPRWGGLVGHPDQWWPITAASLSPGDGRLRLRARPLWSLLVYRYPLEGLPPATRRLLNPPGLRVRAVLDPGLHGVGLCLQSETAKAAGQPCHRLELTVEKPAIEITRWIQPGTLTHVEVDYLTDLDGLPTTMNRIVPPTDQSNQLSPFTLEIVPPATSPKG